jgi:hypothetical protein
VTGVTFSTYNVREQLAAYANQGNAFASWALSFIGGGIQLPSIIITAIGLGALFFISRHIYDLLGIKFDPTSMRIAVAVLSTVIAGYVVSKQLPTFAVAPMLFMIGTAVLITYLMEFIGKESRMKLPN